MGSVAKTERVLAVDPGEKVGWATIELHEGEDFVDAVDDGRLHHGIQPLKESALWIHETSSIDRIVYETWRLRAGKAEEFTGSQFLSVQYIGMVRLCAWIHGAKVVPQSPTIKNTADKTAPLCLRDIIAREPKRHDDAHNVDALRHLWGWFWNDCVSRGVRPR